jgi:GAF domain-containing protein
MAPRKHESVLDVEARPTDEAQRLRTLVEAASALLGSASLDEIVPELLELARQTLQADAYALWEHDLATDAWRIAAHAGLSDEYVETATDAIRGVRTEVSLDEPLIAEDIAATEWLRPAHREAHAREGNEAMLAAGLVHHEKVLGTLVFYYRRRHEFTEPERSAASTLANLAAAAVATTRLYEEQTKTSEERRFLAEASAILASRAAISPQTPTRSSFSTSSRDEANRPAAIKASPSVRASAISSQEGVCQLDAS